MDDIKATAAQHHEDAAYQYDKAAKLHHDAAKQCASGNFEKAETLATTAAEADTVANRSVVAAFDLYRHHAQEVADRKATAASEEDARVAKHEAKAAAEK
jgi:hypothetical protein